MNTNRRRVRDNADRETVKKTILDNCNPFDGRAVSCGRLLNIASGKATSVSSEKYLNSVLEHGKLARLEFQRECAAEDKSRLQKTIKRRTVVNFAKSHQLTAQRKTKAPTSAESMRDAFIKMLILVVAE